MDASKEIKALRSQLGLTQRAFADKVGATVTTVHRWESGACSPSWKHAKCISKLDKQLKGAA